MPTRSRRPLGVISTLVLVSMVAATVALCAVVRSAVRAEQHQLLRERTTEAGLLIGSLFSGLGQDLSVLATTTRPAVGSTDAFTTAAKPLLGSASGVGVAEVTGGSVTVLASVGTGPASGAAATGPRGALLRRAVGAGGMVSATLDDGHGRQLTLAQASANGLVLYETLTFDLSQPYVAQGKGTAFSDLEGAVYASSSADPAALVLSTTRTLPIAGTVNRQSVSIGADHWLIVAKSTRPLVGSLAAKADWGVLIAGLLAAVLATILVETLARRRRYALALVDERTLALRHALEEQARLERDERQARQAAEAANRSKSEFLSRMSHELRTPLNAVLGFGQLLELDDLDESQRESVEQIVKGGRHLLGLINDVLDISRIETGNLAMSSEPVLVEDLIVETLTLMRPLADARQITLISAAEAPGRDVHVLADRQRLKQILLNLVSNAVKYNHAGGTVKVVCQQPEARQMRITVTDSGPGIRSEDLDRLFVAFDRLGAERSDVEGSGVGLALSRRLADAMGATVGVASTFGTGSSFWVELPVVEGPLERYDRLGGGAEEDEPFVEVIDRRHKVLYIEDNLPNVRLVERILERRSDIEVIPAMQGRLGLALAQEHRPALILLDLHLPDLDGREVLRELRNDPATALTPVVMLSADATAGQIERLLAEGADAYLTKPLDVHQLLTIVADSIPGAPAVSEA
jgi:signal transduction histidine kinase/CheY-like chemotaxis protein